MVYSRTLTFRSNKLCLIVDKAVFGLVLPALLLALQGGGALISAFGDISAGNQQRQVANQQAEIYRQNAALDEYNASLALQAGQAAIDQGEYDVRRLIDRQTKAVGIQKASAAAAGMDVGTGTAVDLVAETVYQYELDKGARRYQALMANRNSIIEANNYFRSAAMNQTKALNTIKAGKNAQKQGLISAFGKGLSAAGSIVSSGSSMGLWSLASSKGLPSFNAGSSAGASAGYPSAGAAFGLAMGGF